VTDAAADAPPDALQTSAGMISKTIASQKSAAYLRSALQAWINMDLLPWVNSAEGQEARSVAVGFLGKFFGGLAGGGFANGIEQATDADILAFVALATAVPPAQGPSS
jgi:hypothetical protein